MSPASPLAGVCGKKVEEMKILKCIINALKLIMTLAGVGVCDKSLRIIWDLLELILGYVAGCQLSHKATRFLKKLSLVSLQILASL